MNVSYIPLFSSPLDLLSPFDFSKNAGNFVDFSSFQHISSFMLLLFGYVGCELL